jgi:hypothetical protein
MLPLEKMNIGRKAKDIISKFEVEEKLVFLKGVQEYFIKLSEELLKNLSLSNSFLANLECLNPASRSIKGRDKIYYCAKKIPPGAAISYIELDKLRPEWKNLVPDNIPKDWWYIDEKKEYKPIDQYWSKIMQMKDSEHQPNILSLQKLLDVVLL